VARFATNAATLTATGTHRKQQQRQAAALWNLSSLVLNVVPPPWKLSHFHFLDCEIPLPIAKTAGLNFGYFESLPGTSTSLHNIPRNQYLRHS